MCLAFGTAQPAIRLKAIADPRSLYRFSVPLLPNTRFLEPNGGVLVGRIGGDNKWPDWGDYRGPGRPSVGCYLTLLVANQRERSLLMRTVRTLQPMEPSSFVVTSSAFALPLVFGRIRQWVKIILKG